MNRYLDWMASPQNFDPEEPAFVTQDRRTMAAFNAMQKGLQELLTLAEMEPGQYGTISAVTVRRLCKTALKDVL